MSAVTRGRIVFAPLPPEERGGTDGSINRCCCPYCSLKPGESGPNPLGVWDTLATHLDTGETWKVHYPELHNDRPRLRAAWGRCE